MKYMLLTLITVAAVFVVVELHRVLRTYLKFRGRMLVLCPETHRPATVCVAAAKAAVEGRPPRPSVDHIWAAHRGVSLGYFRAMGIALLSGPSVAATDRDKSVAIVSQTMARR